MQELYRVKTKYARVILETKLEVFEIFLKSAVSLL